MTDASKAGSGKRVFVGMSGGVDSSVSAALLLERGFDVTGVFIKVWQPEWLERTGGCTWREDRLDAMRVCAKLGIPFLELDLEKEYKEEVVDYMIREYKAGRTPNPDVMCNRHVKFGGFFDWAMAQGADFVATGHYARIGQARGADGTVRHVLRSGKDAGKDQSYFLWTLTERELSKTIFPVGDMEKSETRRIAAKLGLPVAEKKDSQGLCFMGKVDLKEFLSHYIEPKRGDVLDASGKVIGEHGGAIFLTLGERHGFTIFDRGADDGPYYIVARDIDANVVVASQHPEKASDAADASRVRLESVNWICSAPVAKKKYVARIRHLGELVPCVIDVAVSGDTATVWFERPMTVAAGQSAVVYDGDICIGGGVAA